ncbi:MAG: hypothetical protein IT259_00615 [Saprospiraceae bacterium]|nr:hypothetical protein [Saprospiraceae bacterium]
MKTLYFLSVLFLLAGCADAYRISPDIKTIGYESTGGEFSLERSEGELKDFMQEVLKKISPRAAKFGTINEAWVQKITLENGSGQYFLFAHERCDTHCSTLAIALSMSPKGLVQLGPGRTCVHRCISSPLNQCTGSCNMNILEACARVLCSCSSAGSCDSEIIITDDE